ncbi:TetR/AcrR family transcriptional regulator [Thalassorhabdus alkalitolerans]|uniref:TetR/AcrR family transcriptional regulator n=1 Tax=Thalassorhabdus alkalitolerans TaxID=2282697 RepID=A0ABW0YMM1_9BACI|nr:TetR/AcrR family transcriptional regulator [Thalassobacillus sp. C254]
MRIDEIKEAARALFAEHGYNGTSLADIADQVGIKKPSLYNHFSSKKELFLVIVEDVFTSYITYVHDSLSALGESNVEDKLKQVLYSTCQFLSSHDVGVLYMRVLMFPPKELENEIKTRFLRCEGVTDDLFNNLIIEGISNKEIREGPVDTYLKAYYCLVDGVATEMFIYETSKVKEKVEASWEIFWQGITA